MKQYSDSWPQSLRYLFDDFQLFGVTRVSNA